ncbi:MAG TPA: hypothetical protein VMR95_01905 [Candidatus Binatia bacterium]|nr:hypothetical protein [Candidatus Binatia bacterium]
MSGKNKNHWFSSTKTVSAEIRPITWQGYLITIIFILLIIGEILLIKSFLIEILVGALLAAAYVSIALMNGGKPNGGVYN